MSYRIKTEGYRVRRTDDGGMLVYDERTDIGHVLNPSVAVVYDLCDGERSVADMARYVAAETGLPADDEIVVLALAQLREAGLLDESEPTTAALASVNTGVTRRSLLKRLAVGAGALALLPAIDSVADVSKLAAATGLTVFAATSISVTTTGGQSVTVTLSVTGQPSAGTLVYSIVTPPAHGTAVIDGDQLTYTPSPGFEGGDVLTYQATLIATTTTPATTGGTTPPTTAHGTALQIRGAFGSGPICRHGVADRHLVGARHGDHLGRSRRGEREPQFHWLTTGPEPVARPSARHRRRRRPPSEIRRSRQLGRR